MAEKPPKKKPERPEAPLNAEAREKGRQARVDGKPRTSCPYGEYPSISLRASWLEGWDGAGPPVTVQEPAMQTPAPPAISTPGNFWPEGKALPEVYRKPEPFPCLECRRVRLEGGARAVILLQTWQGFAYLECRGCGHQRKVRIER